MLQQFMNTKQFIFKQVNPLPLSDVLIHLLLSKTNCSPLPVRTVERENKGGSMDLFWNDPLCEIASSRLQVLFLMHGT